LYGTWEAVVQMIRETFKQETCEKLSTDAERSGGVMHSSDETIVMIVEQRHGLIRLEVV